MRISLNPQTALRIREALGDDVDLAPDLVPGLLARLAVEAPAVYSQVLGELSGSQIRLDSEDQLRGRRRRAALRRLLFSWGEYETGVGDRLVAKRHIAAAVPLSIAALTLTLLAISLAVGHRATPVSAQRVPVSPPRTAFAPSTVPGPYAPRRDALGLSASPVGFLGRDYVAGTIPPARRVLADPTSLAFRSPGNPVVVSTQEAPAQETGRPVSPVVYNRTVEREAGQAETTGRLTPSGPPQPPVPPGTRIPASLVTGVVVVPGGSPTPVVVETANPAGVWIGQAVLGP